MRSENEPEIAQPSAQIYLIVMLASVTSTIVISAIFLLVVSLEPWLTYLVLSVVWTGEFIALAIFHSLYKKTSDSGSNGLVSSSSSTRRADIGSQSPSERR